jgi:hypothetical protein
VIGQPPSAAPPRPDLGWLRHRSLRRPAGDGAAASAVADFLAGRSSRPRRHAAPAEPAPAPTSSLDLSAPAPSPAPTSSLDPSAPEPAPAPASTTSLDLSAPAAPRAPALATSLDLSTPASPPTAPLPAAAPPPRRATHRRPVPRAASGSRTILTPRDPTVTLTRIQSGIGTLTIEAVCSPAVGDIRIGALYELTDGTS